MRFLLFILLMSFCLPGFSQHRAITFQDAELQGLTVQKLDKEYANALDADSTKAVFNGADVQRFYAAYVAMLTDLSTYLTENNFKWDKPTRIFHRIYFKPDGAIDHYLLNLKPTGMEPAKEKQLITLLDEFTKDYKIKITAEKKFAQCSPAIYRDAK